MLLEIFRIFPLLVLGASFPFCAPHVFILCICQQQNFYINEMVGKAEAGS